MDAHRFDALTRTIDLRAPRRAALGGALGGGIAALTTRFRIFDAEAKKKKKKKKKCKNCGPCKTCVKGKCQAVPNGEICGDNCEQCLFGFCDEPACFAPECLANRTCAALCDPEIQDCQDGCWCTGDTVGSDDAYCTVQEHPACESLQACSSTAACPSGHICQQCDRDNRCLPLCPF